MKMKKKTKIAEPTAPTTVVAPTPVGEASPAPAAPPQRRIIRRRKKGTGGKYYFTPATQAAIVEYQNATEQKKREQIYVTEIFPAFEKLVENLINIHKFSGLYDSYDDLKNDCVTFLFEQIRKFDNGRGTNAFSYFNIIAKNWLIIRTKQKSTRIKRNVSLDDIDGMSAREMKIMEERNVVPSQETMIESANFVNGLTDMLNTIRDSVKTQNELACMNSIMTIFENIDSVDLLSKSAILLYIRELSGMSPKQLTATLHSLKKQYRKIKSETM